MAGSAWAAPFRSRTHACLHTIPIFLGFVKWKVRLHSGPARGSKPDRCLPKGPRHPHHRGFRRADGCGGALLGTATSPASTNMIAGKRGFAISPCGPQVWFGITVKLTASCGEMKE